MATGTAPSTTWCRSSRRRPRCCAGSPSPSSFAPASAKFVHSRPDAMLHRPRFVIAVPDLQRSANYYRDILGFTIHDIGDPGWRFMQRDEFAILAGECPDAIPPRELGDHSYFAYIGVDHIDALYAELAAKNAEILNPPRDEPWGMREFGVTTIDGHRIRFGTPTTKSA